MEYIGSIITALSVLIAGGATIHLGVGVGWGESSSGLTIRYALAMIYTALYAMLFSIGAIIQAIAKMCGGA